MNKIITGILGGLITLSATVPALAANIIYTSQKAGYTATFPGTWTLTPTKGMVDVLMMSPADSANDTYKENISIVVEPTTLNTSQLYFADNKIAMVKALPTMKIVSEGVYMVDKKPAYWMNYTQNINGMKIQSKSFFFYRNGNGYVVTGSTVPSAYGAYAPIFNSVVDSIKF